MSIDQLESIKYDDIAKEAKISRTLIYHYFPDKDCLYKTLLGEILTFINENICGDLTIDALAEKFYISKFHMMRRFKCETGYTIHNYVINRRLLAAKQLIARGEAATSVCYKCGFHDYSTFSRAYKKTFDESPAGRGKEEKELKI